MIFFKHGKITGYVQRYFLFSQHIQAEIDLDLLSANSIELCLILLNLSTFQFIHAQVADSFILHIGMTFFIPAVLLITMSVTNEDHYICT